MKIYLSLKFVAVILFIGFLVSCEKPLKHATATSPNGKIGFHFMLDSIGAPNYFITNLGKPVIVSSALGFELENDNFLRNDFNIINIEQKLIDETWEPVWGQFSSYRNHCNELKITLQETSGSQRVLVVKARVFDDGVGFRYEFPLQPNLDSLRITDELTEFRFAGDHQTWYTDADFDTYELGYHITPLSEMKSANTPFTMKTADEMYLSLHEANLTDYAGMTVKAKSGSDFAFEADLAPWPDGIKVKCKVPCKTPWRTLQISDTPGELITSGLILNLNEPNQLEDVSYIEPMKYVGIWWSLHQGVETWTMGPTHGATTENMKNLIDFAFRHNIRGVLAEGWNKGWEDWGGKNNFDFTTPYNDFDIEEIVAYAKKNNVALISHHETGGNVTSYEANLNIAFNQLKKYGIHSLKTGYAGPIQPDGHVHHNQFMVRHYRKVVECAAENRVMLNVHEPIKPTGIERTFPNMMTREGARGMEWNGWSHDVTPEHTLILPFTRILAGPMDYTPGIFDLKYESYDGKRRKWHPSRGDITSMRVKTTLAKQLALMVILYSPVQMAADMIEIYEGHPAFQFFKDLNVDFDHTIVLDAEIGDYMSIARRSNEEWFVGVATDENQRRFEVPLNFLNEGRKYNAVIYEDAPETDLENNPGAYQIREMEVDNKTIITALLKESGGMAISIKPLR